MKTHHGAEDKSQLEQQICGSALIFYIVRKNWPHASYASESYAGWLADR